MKEIGERERRLADVSLPTSNLVNELDDRTLESEPEHEFLHRRQFLWNLHMTIKMQLIALLVLMVKQNSHLSLTPISFQFFLEAHTHAREKKLTSHASLF